MQIALELALIGALVLLNGLLAMSELAVVSARKARLEAMARRKRRGALIAIQLAAEPGRFLSAVQIGITLVGIFAGAFSGATLAERFALWLATEFLLSETVADTIAFAVVVGSVTYLSLVVGELVPKQLALKNPEAIAAAMAPFLKGLATVAKPAVLLLDVSSQAILRLFGTKSSNNDAVTEEEIHHLVAEAESAGTVEPAEREMIKAVLRLGDRPVRTVMTPRHDLDWLDLDAPHEELVMRLRATTHLLLPAAHGSIDEPVGCVGVKDVLDIVLDGGRDKLAGIGFAGVVQPVPAVHESADLLDVLELLQRSPTGMAFVVDEFGGLEGVVTANDILESIAGSFALPDDGSVAPGLLQRADGSWLIDGSLAREVMAEALHLPMPDEADYHTAAGFVLARFGRLPAAGDRVEWQGWVFEVMDMDGRRIDKLLAIPPAQQGAHDS